MISLGLPSQNTIVIEDPVEKEGGVVKAEITVMEGTKVVAKAHIDIADAKDVLVEAEMMAETLNPVDIAVAVEVHNRGLEVERLTHHLTEVEQI